jgi:hypothetical protein
MTARAVVIGAGPSGLEAALGLVERGFDVTVLEKDRVGASLLRWGAHTRFFSPLGMNVSSRARRALGRGLGPEEAMLTGPEMVERVLEPLARSPALAGRVRLGHRAAGVGRARLTRGELAGHPIRAERPFCVLAEGPEGEYRFEAEVVLDATGVCDTPAAIGSGGVPAPGERGLAERLVRHLGDLEARLPDLAGRDVLLVGHGHSAANALALLSRVDPAPRVTWAVRTPNRHPVVQVSDDPLPERRGIVDAANQLAATPPPFLKLERRAGVESLQRAAQGAIDVGLSGGRGGRYDVVLGFTGYRPDLSFLSELALEVSPLSEGPARLAAAVAGATDCLSPPRVRGEDLATGEPGFHFVGAKSYGRIPTFLLQTGLEHLDSILDGLAGRTAA